MFVIQKTARHRYCTTTCLSNMTWGARLVAMHCGPAIWSSSRTRFAAGCRTGIYIGGGQFIHAENESTGVRISDLDSDYYSSRWYGAVRYSCSRLAGDDLEAIAAVQGSRFTNGATSVALFHATSHG